MGWSQGPLQVTSCSRAYVGGGVGDGAEAPSEPEQKEEREGLEGLAFV